MVGNDGDGCSCACLDSLNSLLDGLVLLAVDLSHIVLLNQLVDAVLAGHIVTGYIGDDVQTVNSGQGNIGSQGNSTGVALAVHIQDDGLGNLHILGIVSQQLDGIAIVDGGSQSLIDLGSDHCAVGELDILTGVQVLGVHIVDTNKLEGLHTGNATALPNVNGFSCGNLAVLHVDGLGSVVLNHNAIADIGHDHILKSCTGAVDPVEAVTTAVNGDILDHHSGSSPVRIQEASAVIGDRTVLHGDALDGVRCNGIASTIHKVHILDRNSGGAGIALSRNVASIVLASAVDGQTLVDGDILSHICQQGDGSASGSSSDGLGQLLVLDTVDHGHIDHGSDLVGAVLVDDLVVLTQVGGDGQARRSGQGCVGSAQHEVVESRLDIELINRVCTLKDVGGLGGVVSSPGAQDVQLAVLDGDGLRTKVGVLNCCNTGSDVHILQNNSAAVINLDTVVHIADGDILHGGQSSTRNQLHEAVAVVLCGAVLNGQVLCATGLNSIAIITLAVEVDILDDGVSLQSHLAGVGLAGAVDGHSLADGDILGDVSQQGDGSASGSSSDGLGQLLVLDTVDHGHIDHGSDLVGAVLVDDLVVLTQVGGDGQARRSGQGGIGTDQHEAGLCALGPCISTDQSVCTHELVGVHVSGVAFPDVDGIRTSDTAVGQGDGLGTVVLGHDAVGHIGHGDILNIDLGAVYNMDTVVHAVDICALDIDVGNSGGNVQEAEAVVLDRDTLNGDGVAATHGDGIVDGLVNAVEVTVLDGQSAGGTLGLVDAALDEDDILNGDGLAVGDGHRAGVVLAITVDGHVLVDGHILGNVDQQLDGIAILGSSNSLSQSCVVHIADHSHTVLHADDAVLLQDLVAGGDILAGDLAGDSSLGNSDLDGPFGGALGNEQVNIALQLSSLGNNQLTVVGLGTGIMEEDGLVHTLNGAAVDDQLVLLGVRIQELTDAAVGGLDMTTVDGNGDIADAAVGQRVDTISHIGAAQVLDGAAVDDQRAAGVVGDDCGVTTPTGVDGGIHDDLTGANGIVDGQRAVVLEQTEVLFGVIRTGDGLAVQVDGDGLAGSHSYGLSQLDVTQDSDNIRCLSSCDCSSQSGIVDIADLGLVCGEDIQVVNAVQDGVDGGRNRSFLVVDGGEDHLIAICIAGQVVGAFHGQLVAVSGVLANHDGQLSLDGGILHGHVGSNRAVSADTVAGCDDVGILNLDILGGTNSDTVLTADSDIVNSQAVTAVALEQGVHVGGGDILDGDVEALTDLHGNGRVTGSTGGSEGGILHGHIVCVVVILTMVRRISINDVVAGLVGNEFHVLDGQSLLASRTAHAIDLDGAGEGLAVAVDDDVHTLGLRDHDILSVVGQQNDVVVAFDTVGQSISQSFIAEAGVGVLDGVFADLDTEGAVAVLHSDIALSAVGIVETLIEATAGDEAVGTGINSAGEGTAGDSDVGSIGGEEAQSVAALTCFDLTARDGGVSCVIIHMDLNCTLLTIDLAAGDIQGVLAGIAIVELTDGHVSGDDLTAGDGGSHIAQAAVGQQVDGKSVDAQRTVVSGIIPDDAALDLQVGAGLAADGGDSHVGGSGIGVGVDQGRTVDDQVAAVGDHVLTGNVGGVGDGDSLVQLQSLACGNHSGGQHDDLIASICSSNCISQSSIAQITDLCGVCGEDLLGAADIQLNTDLGSNRSFLVVAGSEDHLIALVVAGQGVVLQSQLVAGCSVLANHDRQLGIDSGVLHGQVVCALAVGTDTVAGGFDLDIVDHNIGRSTGRDAVLHVGCVQTADGDTSVAVGLQHGVHTVSNNILHGDVEALADPHCSSSVLSSTGSGEAGLLHGHIVGIALNGTGGIGIDEVMFCLGSHKLEILDGQSFSAVMAGITVDGDGAGVGLTIAVDDDVLVGSLDNGHILTAVSQQVDNIAVLSSVNGCLQGVEVLDGFAADNGSGCNNLELVLDVVIACSLADFTGCALGQGVAADGNGIDVVVVAGDGNLSTIDGIAGNGIAGEHSLLSSADVDSGVGEGVAGGGDSLGILSILVIGQAASPILEGGVSDGNSHIADVGTCALAEDDGTGVGNGSVANEVAVVNGQVCLCRDGAEAVVGTNGLAHVHGQVLDGCIGLEAECSEVISVVDRVGELNGMTITVDGNRNGDLAAGVSSIPFLSDGDILLQDQLVAGLQCLQSIGQLGVADLADLGNEGNGSQNGLVANLDGNVIVGIGVVALLVVPQAVVGNIALAEAGGGGGGIDGDVGTGGQAGVDLDGGLAVHGCGSIEGGADHIQIDEVVCILGVDQHGLTGRVEGTVVELDLLCAVGPDIVVAGGLVEDTVVEGLGLAVQEHLTVEGTVGVHQVAGVLQALVGGVVGVGEGHIVEGDACAAHVVITDVVEDNIVNHAGDGDVLAGGNLIGASPQDLNLVAVLCSGISSLQSLELLLTNLSHIGDDLIVANNCGFGQNGGAVFGIVGLVCGENTLSAVDEGVVLCLDGSTLNIQGLLVGIAQILEGVAGNGDLVDLIGLDQTVSIVTAGNGGAGHGELALVQPDCVLVGGVGLNGTIGQGGLAAQTDAIDEGDILEGAVDVVLVHELVGVGVIGALVSEGDVLEGHALDIGNAVADDGQLGIGGDTRNGDILAQIQDTVRTTGGQLHGAGDLIDHRVSGISLCVCNSLIHRGLDDRIGGSGSHSADLNDQMLQLTNLVRAIFLLFGNIVLGDVSNRVLIEGTAGDSQLAFVAQGAVLAAGEAAALDGDFSICFDIHSSTAVSHGALGADEGAVLNDDLLAASTADIHGMVGALGSRINLVHAAVDGNGSSALNTDSVTGGGDVHIVQNQLAGSDLNAADALVGVDNGTVLHGQETLEGLDAAVQSLAIQIQLQLSAVGNLNLAGSVLQQNDGLACLSSIDSLRQRCVAVLADCHNTGLQNIVHINQCVGLVNTAVDQVGNLTVSIAVHSAAIEIDNIVSIIAGEDVRNINEVTAGEGCCIFGAPDVDVILFEGSVGCSQGAQIASQSHTTVDFTVGEGQVGAGSAVEVNSPHGSIQITALEGDRAVLHTVAVTEGIAACIGGSEGAILDQTGTGEIAAAGAVNEVDILDLVARALDGGNTIQGNIALAGNGNIVPLGIQHQSVIVGASHDGNSCAVGHSSHGLSDGSAVGAVDLGLCALDDGFQNLALDLLFLSVVDGQGDSLFGNTGGVLVHDQGQSTIVGDVGGVLVMDGDSALDLGVLQSQRSAVSALDPQLDGVLVTADVTVGGSAAGSGDQQAGALGIDGDVLHGIDDILSCVAAVVSLDTIGQSCAHDGHILDGANTGSRALLQNDTADGLVGIALALDIDHKVLECSSIPNLDGSGVACVDNGTILDGGIALDAHAAVSIAGGQGLAAQIQGDGLGDGQLSSAVVDVSSQDDGIAFLSCCQSGIQFSLGGNLDGRILGSELILCIDGLCVDVVLHTFGQIIALCLDRQNIICAVRAKIDFSLSGVVVEHNAFRSTDINIGVQSVAGNGDGLNVLAALVVRNCSSGTGQSGVLDLDLCCGQFCVRGALTEDDAVPLCAADDGQAVNRQALLGRDDSLCTGSLADVDSQILNSCILFESEDRVPVVIVDSIGELDGMSVTVDGHRLLELRVRSVGCIVSAIPLVVDGDIPEDLDGAALGCSLEGIYQSGVANIADHCNAYLHIEGTVSIGDCLVARHNISSRIGIEVAAADVQLGHLVAASVQDPGIHAAAEGTAGNIDDGGACIASLVAVVLSRQNIQVAVIAHGAIGVGDPLAAGDIDGTAGGHGDEAALDTLAVAAVDIDSTVAASADQTAVVAGGAIHVDLSTVVDVDGRSDALDTQIAVLTGDDSASFDIQNRTASDLDNRAIVDVVDQVDALQVDGELLGACGRGAQCTVGSGAGIDSTVLQGDDIGLGAVILEVQQVVIDGAVVGNGEAVQIDGKALVADIVQAVVPTAILGTGALVDDNILQQLDGAALGHCVGSLGQGAVVADDLVVLTDHSDGLANQLDTLLGQLSFQRIVTGNNNSTVEAGCVSNHGNITISQVGGINGDGTGTADGGSGQAGACAQSQSTDVVKGSIVGQTGVDQDQLACILVLVIGTIVGCLRHDHRIGEGELRAGIVGHEHAVDQQVGLVHGQDRVALVLIELEAVGSNHGVVDDELVIAVVVASLVAEGLVALDTKDDIGILNGQLVLSIGSDRVGHANQTAVHIDISIRIRQILTGSQSIGQLAVDGDLIAVTQAITLVLGQGHRCALFNSPGHGSGGTVVIGQGTVVIQHIEGIVTTEGNVTCNKHAAANSGILDDRTIEEVDLLTDQCRNVQRRHTFVDIDGALVGCGAVDCQVAAFHIDGALGADVQDICMVGALDVHNAEALAADTHAVLVDNGNGGAGLDGQGCGFVGAADGFACVTAVGPAAAVNSQVAVAHNDGFISVDQVVQLNVGVLDHQDTIVGGVVRALAAGNVDSGGCNRLLDRGGDVRAIEDDLAIALAVATDHQVALGPVDDCGTGDGDSLAADHGASHGNDILTGDQHDGVAVLGCSISLSQSGVLQIADLCLSILTADTLAIQAGIVQLDDDLTGGSGRQLAVLLVLAGTDGKPHTVSVLGGHGVGAGDSDVAVHGSITHDHGDECGNSVVRDDSIVVVRSIHTDTVAVDIDVTALNSDALDSAQCQAALGVGDSNILDGQIPAGGVLQEGVQAGAGAVLDDHAVAGLQTDRNGISLLSTGAGEGAALNGQSGIMVGCGAGDEITSSLSDKVDVLDGDPSVVVGVGQSRNGDGTIHLVAVAIDGVIQTGLLGQRHILGHIAHQSDSDLAGHTGSSIQRSLQGCVALSADLGNSGSGSLVRELDAVLGEVLGRNLHVVTIISERNCVGADLHASVEHLCELLGHGCGNRQTEGDSLVQCADSHIIQLGSHIEDQLGGNIVLHGCSGEGDLQLLDILAVLNGLVVVDSLVVLDSLGDLVLDLIGHRLALACAEADIGSNLNRLVVGVRLAAVAALNSVGVATVTLEGVAQLGALISYGLLRVAAVALCGLGAVSGAGCVVVGHIVGEAVTLGIHTAVHIGVGAAGAGMGGVTLLGTGRIGHNRLVVMAQFVDGLSLGMTTVFSGTQSDLQTILGTGGSLIHRPVSKGMTQRIGGHIGTTDLNTADGTLDHGIIGAASGAGCIDHILLHGLAIGVAQSTDGFGISIIALGAGVGLNTRSHAAGSSGLLAIVPVMTGFRSSLLVNVATSGAGLGLHTGFLAGCGGAGSGVGVGMSSCTVNNLCNADCIGAGVHDKPLASLVGKCDQVAFTGLHRGNDLIARDTGEGAVSVSLQQIELVSTIALVAVTLGTIIVLALIPARISTILVGFYIMQGTGIPNMEKISADSNGHLAITLKCQRKTRKGNILLGDAIAVGGGLDIVVTAVAQAVGAFGAGQNILAFSQRNNTAVPVRHRGLCVLHGQTVNAFASGNELLTNSAVGVASVAFLVQGGALGVLDLGILMIIADIKLRNGDPTVVGELCNKFHIPNLLLFKAEGLGGHVGIEYLILCNKLPLSIIGTLDIQAGLFDQTAGSVLTGSEGELIDVDLLTKVDLTGDITISTHLIFDASIIGVPVGGRIAIECFPEFTFVSILVDCLGVNGTREPALFTRELYFKEVHSGTGCPVAKCTPGTIASDTAQCIDIPFAGILNDITVTAGQKFHNFAITPKLGEGIIIDYAVQRQAGAVSILQHIAALYLNQSPGNGPVMGACKLLGEQRAMATLTGISRGHGIVIAVICFETNNIGLTSFRLNGSQCDTRCIAFCRLCVSNGHHADDHDEYQQQAKKSFKFTSHFFFHPFLLI